MARSVTQIRCPNCGSPIQAAIEQLVDVAQDPSAKARLLSGSLNLARCPNCRYEGQLSTPLVYHDPAKELLLTFLPVEVGLNKDDQERLIGQLINQAVSRLPAEQRKGYLFQPQAVLTVQGMLERILAADGITREQLEAQRGLMKLFEEMLHTPEEGLAAFAAQHDQDLGAAFFQLAAAAIQSAPDERAAQAAEEKLEAVIGASSFGKRLAQQEAELRAAADSLRGSGADLTRERLLDLILTAPGPDRVAALVSLARPALDYEFFSLLSSQIEQAEGADKERLTDLRQQLLDLTQEIDRVQDARVSQSAALLKSIAAAADLEQAVAASLPYIDDLFMGILQANLRAATERGDKLSLQRLQQVEAVIHQLLRQAMPEGLQLADEVLQAEDIQKARALLEASAGKIDEQTLGALMGAAQRLEQSNEPEMSAEIRELHRTALRLSMQAKLATGGSSASPLSAS
ncbi:MAG: CpXC domain-containing protein [Anaerolineales bacterium]|nr:CpXC domain-containing protein [Anaerolineales bacterium]